MFGCIAYAMVFDEMNDKLDAKGTECLFLGYCAGTNVYILIYVQTKKIIKYRDIVFMDDGMSIHKDLDIRPSGRNEVM